MKIPKDWDKLSRPITRELLLRVYNGGVPINCKGLSCVRGCVFGISEITNNKYMCGLPRPELLFDRLLEHGLITKGEALDMVLSESKEN